MPDREYGEIPGYPEGQEFQSRRELAEAKVHRPLQSGISGAKDGADSIVVSGGYPDDEDHGDEIIYTGQGGRDPNTGHQIADQELTRGNLGLVRSELDGRPVRLIRGSGGDPAYSPARGLRYDGLYQVTEHWHDSGRDGFRIWRFRLVKLSSSPRQAVAPAAQTIGPAPRTAYNGNRLVRDPSVPERVKQLHNFTCQVCGIRLLSAGGPYAEGAYIRGLGRPHDGPDHESNMLCLCPNDHFRFDAGAIYVDDGMVWNALTDSVVGLLRTAKGHEVDPGHLRYHRDHFAAAEPT
ncbi:YDG/SRA domain-containing protein [Saccharomonospora sp. NPDC046836]|uniref:YDG/SRA domain-containing protein n=1 Tax=Saccharomonospora sp. NPDC046836 TaxID=3156921 RepID=UPI003409FAF0